MAVSNRVVLQTNLPLPLLARGKVRDIYQVGNDLLFVATDRISAFDVILPNGIPGKGEILTQLSLFWFEFLTGMVENHLLTADASLYPALLRPHRDVLQGRSMLVRRAEMFPVECVARGYLAGSGWKEYRQTGQVCGNSLPAGLVESDRLPEPIFTPATKAESGHDENISFDRMIDITGPEIADELRSLTLMIYDAASRYAETRGLIIADTKFEFGQIGGKFILADEVLTPDSSRFWPAAEYSPGRPQRSYDKQYVRDWLETQDWNKQPPAPVLPEEVVMQTAAKYREAYQLLAGVSL